MLLTGIDGDGPSPALSGEQQEHDGERAGFHGIVSRVSSALVVHGIALALDENDRRGQVLKLVRVAVRKGCARVAPGWINRLLERPEQDSNLRPAV